MNYSAKIINEIKRRIYGKEKPVKYLMDLLPMSRETAYRRLRHETPFSFDEAVIIADNLDFSIDRLIELKSCSNFLFNREFNLNLGPVDIYSSILVSDIEMMEKASVSKDVKVTAAINKIPLRLFPYKSLFKLDYFHYLYSIGKISLMTRYSEISVPPDINDLHDKLNSCFNNLNNITCIFDKMILSDIIKKIQYYNQSKFISNEDLHILQSELLELLNVYENLLRNGSNSYGSKYTFYYSFFNLESNVIFFEYDQNSILQIWIYPESPVVIRNNKTLYEVQRRWIDSKLRNSVLITKSNESQQVEILREMHKQIEELRAEN